ncbi:MAG TPA: hypothetical protein VHL30_03905, partial [Chlamydiales bacterium]|nr:hypothetical protein [Chlamydiales bacterium]
MTTRVESTKDLLNETQPAVVETKNRFEYLCLNATKAYFREVVSENQTYITVIAKISLLAFPLIAAFALLEAAFDLLMAPITFIANCIAGPQEVPPEIPPADREDSKTLGVPPPAPVTPYKITESVDDIGLVKKRKPIQRSGSL